MKKFKIDKQKSKALAVSLAMGVGTVGINLCDVYFCEDISQLNDMELNALIGLSTAIGIIAIPVYYFAYKNSLSQSNDEQNTNIKTR